MGPAEIDKKLDELSKLEVGWDGYRAYPITPETIAAARVVAHLLAKAGRQISLVPTSAETIAIEWVENGLECVADIAGTRER